MSSFLSGGGGRTYGFDLEIVKPRLTSPRTSQTSSSPTSTISESSNSPLSISNRKPRTPRKRPNQTYNEAAALLSRVYPGIFPADNPQKFTKLPCDLFLDEPESSELFIPYREIHSSDNFLLDKPPAFQAEQKLSPAFGEIQSKASDLPVELLEDFDAESIILDEEIDEGIDSIMGGSTDKTTEPAGELPKAGARWDSGLVTRNRIRVWKRAEEMSYWWNFPTVDVLEISPKLSYGTNPSPPADKKPPTMTTTKKNHKKKVEKLKSLSELKPVEPPKEPAARPASTVAEAKQGLMLKLNYDGVLGAWGGKASPFSDDAPGSEATAADVSTRLAQIDLFTENDIVREASVLRYKEKRRTRLFAKKIRYQVRKDNADQRPRMKGRFVRGTNSTTNDQR